MRSTRVHGPVAGEIARTHCLPQWRHRPSRSAVPSVLPMSARRSTVRRGEQAIHPEKKCAGRAPQADWPCCVPRHGRLISIPPAHTAHRLLRRWTRGPAEVRWARQAIPPVRTSRRAANAGAESNRNPQSRWWRCFGPAHAPELARLPQARAKRLRRPYAPSRGASSRATADGYPVDGAAPQYLRANDPAMCSQETACSTAELGRHEFFVRWSIPCQ